MGLSGARHEPGLESVAVNDLLSSHAWSTMSSWKWGRPAHINVLETAAGLTLMNKLAKSRDLRYLHVLDSNVARGALTKGRSSSRSLRVPLLRAAATQVVGGLYPAFVFGPTRLNVSDAPTRNRPLPPRASISLTSCFDDEALYDLCELKGLSRPRANWLRLGLLLACTARPRGGLDFLNARGEHFRDGFVQGYDPTQEPLPRREPARAFDSTLGFSEEGPNEDPGTASRLLPMNLQDQQRLQSRRSCELQVGRPVQSRTSGNRAALLRLSRLGSRTREMDSWSSSMPSLLTLNFKDAG